MSNGPDEGYQRSQDGWRTDRDCHEYRLALIRWIALNYKTTVALYSTFNALIGKGSRQRNDGRVDSQSRASEGRIGHSFQ